jgi:hypothetical protein
LTAKPEKPLNMNLVDEENSESLERDERIDYFEWRMKCSNRWRKKEKMSKKP